MEKKRRWASRPVVGVLLLAVLTVVLGACGGDDGDGEQTADGGGGEEQTVYLIPICDNTFYQTMKRGAEEAASAIGNVTIEYQSPQDCTPQAQVPVLSAALAAKPAAVMVAPADAKAMYEPIKQIADAGIAVVLVDSQLDDNSIASSVIATDNVQGGREAANAMEELGVEGQVAGVSTVPGMSTLDQRMEGFEEGVQQSSGMEYLGTKYAEDSDTKAAQVTSALLKGNPDLAGIFAGNDFTGAGAAVGLKQSGASDVALVAFDTSPVQVQALRDGDIDALIAQDPFSIGKIGTETSMAVVDGEEVEPEVSTPLKIVTQDNVDDPAVEQFLYAP